MKRLATVFLMLSSAAWSMTDQEYRPRLSRLQQGTNDLDRMIARLGVRPLGQTSDSGSTSKDEESPAPLFRLHATLQTARLSQGKILYGRTFNRLIVGGENSPAVVSLRGESGLPVGTRALGIARASGIAERVVIEVSKLSLPSGMAVAVNAVGLDSEGSLGLAAQVFSSKALAVAGALASSFVSGLAASQQSQTVNAFGFAQTETSGRNAILQGVAQTAADQSKRLIAESTAEKPILIVEPGTEVALLINEEVRW